VLKGGSRLTDVKTHKWYTVMRRMVVFTVVVTLDGTEDDLI